MLVRNALTSKIGNLSYASKAVSRETEGWRAPKEMAQNGVMPKSFPILRV